MSDPVVPTLGATPYITDPAQMLVNLLRHYSTAPKSATDTWADLTISLTYTVAKHKDSPQGELENAVRSELHGCLERITGEAPSIGVTRNNSSEDGGFSLVIEPTIFVNGVPYGVSASIGVDSSNRITFQLSGD